MRAVRLRDLRRAVAFAGCAVSLCVFAAGPALAAKGGGGGTHGGGHGGGSTGGTPTGYDISYPQCRKSFPTDVSFGVVGVNDGIVYSANPCLGTGDGPSELAWAEQYGAPSFYANTADPGPAYSSYWKISDWKSSPRTCSSTDPNTPDCSYDYGWYAAKDSFADAVSAEVQVNGFTQTDATVAAVGSPWWLDVETGNSWQSLETAYSSNLSSAYANDTAALQGAADFLTGQGVTSVGYYSTSYQWGQITGGANLGASYPDWLAGYSDLSGAQAACTITTGFSGGRVELTQYPASGFDADYHC